MNNTGEKQVIKEVALAGQGMAGGTDLVVKVEPTFNLPMLSNPEEAAEIIAENLDGMGEFRFEKIKMPSGGGIAFTVVDEAGEEQPLKELRGVILDKFPFKAWYAKSFDEKGVDDTGAPDCFSDDGVHGSGSADYGIAAGQLCEKCRYGQWGSDRKGGKGKDCSDKIRVHILMEGEAFPKVIDAPPTSLANFKEYVGRLSNKMKVFYGVVSSLKLEKAKSGGNIEYSKVVFSKAAELTADERKAVKGYRATLMGSMRKITLENIAEDVSGGVSVNDPNYIDSTDDGGADQPY